MEKDVTDMLKVLIVDDEKEIREGLKTVFPWAECGVSEVYTAEDGDEALAEAQRLDPDLVLTDIKMNRMDGLELIGKLRESCGFEGKAIVISGYDDFAFVRQALKLGASDYLLKPIQVSELQQVVGRAAADLSYERTLKSDRQMLEYQLRQAVPRMKEELLRDLIDQPSNSHGDIRIAHRLKTLELDWMLETPMALLVVEADDTAAIKGRKREKELILFAIGNVSERVVQEKHEPMAVLFQDRDERWVIIISQEPCVDRSVYEELSERLIEKINTFVKVKATIALASSFGGWNALSDLYREAVVTLELKALYGGNQLFVADDRELDLGNVEVSLGNRQEVLDLLQFGSELEIREAMHDFPALVRAWSLSNSREIQGKLFDWLYDVFKLSASAGCDDLWWENELLAIWDRIEQFDTLESLCELTTSYLLRLAGGFNARKPSQNMILTEAEKYIQAHYQENLTLQKVSQQVCVTPIWLSKLFKKEKQTTFLEYLTTVRIQHAKPLLADARFRIYQVGQEVGYSNPEHFTKIFKKAVGCTPKEYRNQRGINDE